MLVFPTFPTLFQCNMLTYLNYWDNTAGGYSLNEESSSIVTNMFDSFLLCKFLKALDLIMLQLQVPSFSMVPLTLFVTQCS